jgi:hypothetical protein
MYRGIATVADKQRHPILFHERRFFYGKTEFRSELQRAKSPQIHRERIFPMNFEVRQIFGQKNCLFTIIYLVQNGLERHHRAL